MSRLPISRTRIKFCGIRRQVDAQAAVALGVDAVGFVLVPKSKRHIAPERAAAIAATLPPFVATVALFKDAPRSEVRRAIKHLRPDWLQFHGTESPTYCASFGLPYLRAVSMSQGANLQREARDNPAARALLLDSHSAGGMGGQGRTFDWSMVGPCRKPLVLAGGLDADNVGDAISQLHPYAVDVSSGIESKPGIKDPERMRAFVEAVRRADENAS